MNRSPEAMGFNMSREVCTFYASLQGAGAATPTIPTKVLSLTTSIQPMTAQDNFASEVAGDIVRSGVGTYTVKFKDGLPVVLDIGISLWGLDGKWAQMTDYNPATRVASFKTFAAAGAAADIVSTDNVKLTIVGRLSV